MGLKISCVLSIGWTVYKGIFTYQPWTCRFTCNGSDGSKTLPHFTNLDTSRPTLFCGGSISTFSTVHMVVFSGPPQWSCENKLRIKKKSLPRFFKVTSFGPTSGIFGAKVTSIWGIKRSFWRSWPKIFTFLMSLCFCFGFSHEKTCWLSNCTHVSGLLFRRLFPIQP